MKKIPDHIVCLEKTPELLRISFVASADLFWFKGHFPQHTLLPGVAQIDWVIYFMAHFFARNIILQGAARIKFQNPIIPGDEVYLTLTLKTDYHLHFIYTSASDHTQIKSQGTIKIA